MFKDMRVRFCKIDSAVYFSHLDLNRAIQRALRRSGVPFWSTGGFSPHPYCVFAQPLSLGYESVGELFDFRLMDGEAWDPEQLFRAFPENLKVMEIYEPRDAFKTIAYAVYEIFLKTDADAEQVKCAFQNPMTVLKKSKRSETEVDVRDFLGKIEAKPAEGGVLLRAETAAGNEKNLSPQYLLEGLKNGGIPCEAHRICRVGFLKADGTEFR